MSTIQIGVPNFSITTLPGGSTWPSNLLRDSFQASNERQTIREDRTESAPVELILPVAVGLVTTSEVDLADLSTAVPNRLLSEIQIPSFTAEQLPAGTSLKIEIEGSVDGFGSWVTVATATIVGTDETTEPSTISYRPSVGSTVGFVRAAATRIGAVSEKPSQIELRVFYSADQLRQKRYLTGHLLASTESTTNAAFQGFLDQDFVTDPIVYHGRETGGTAGQVYSGAWVILRVDVDDNQNSSSLVRISMEQTPAWRDV